MVKYTRCSVYGCSVRNLQFFHFPRNVQRAVKWRELAGNPALYAIPLEKLHHKASVCKRHFTRDQFTNTKLDRLNLNSFPSLHLPPPCTPDSTDLILQPAETSPNSSPVLHYVVFPTVDPSIIAAPAVELPDEDKVCLEGVAEPSDVNVQETVPPTEFQCPTVEPSVQDVAPPSFAVLTEYCEAGNVGEEGCESEEEVVKDGHYKYTLCRLCFSTLDIITTDIFSVDKGCGYVIKDVIEDLLQFKVSKTDEYPQFICVSCLNKLTEFREFKEKILKDTAVFEEALRKLKSSVAEQDGLTENVGSEDANQQPEICSTNLFQLISFDASGDDINVDVPNSTSEVMKDGDGQGELVGEDKTAEDGKQEGNSGGEAVQRLEEDFTDLIEETARDLANSEVFGEVDRLTASVEEPVIDPELLIRRELNTGVVGAGEGSRSQDGGQQLQHRDHLVKHRKGQLQGRPLSKCHLCGKRFKKQEDLDKHLLLHSNLSLDECSRCGVVLKVAVPQNGKTSAAPKKPPICATCRKAFSEAMLIPNQLGVPSSLKFIPNGEQSGRECNVDILVMKDSRSHRGKKLYSCRQCGKSFPMTEILERHMKLSHFSKKRFRCEHCNERFALKRCLYDHVKLHTRGMS